MKILRCLVLLTVLASPAFAGDIQNGAPSPEPQPSSGSAYTGDPSDMPNNASMTATVVTEILLDLLSLY